MQPRPEIDADFCAWMEERGWRCYTEFLPPLEELDANGDLVAGFWSFYISREEKIGDEMHIYVMSLDPSITQIATDAGKRGLYELAEANWRDYLSKIPA